MFIMEEVMVELRGVFGVKEVAQYLGVAEVSVYRLLARKEKNEFPGHKVGRVWKFYLEEVDRWLKGRR
jgi:excisionase family DNA binding protein